MSRDSSGTYSQATGNFQNGTIVDAAPHNTRWTDMGTEMTDSLSRSGKGGMLARLRGVDGTAASPAYSFTDENTLGIYRAGSADMRVASNNVDILKCNTTEIRAYIATVCAAGLSVTGAATVSAGLTVTQSTSNGAGTTSTGNGSGAGGVFTGGATGRGLTVSGGATSGDAIVATGTGSLFSGIIATGGPGGVGGVFSAGTNSTAADPTVAIRAVNGHIEMTATEPNKEEAFTDTVTPINVCKAWANISLNNSTSPVLNDGFNVASITINGSKDLVVTLASSFANTTYAVHPVAHTETLLIYANARAVNTTTFSGGNPITGDVDVALDTRSETVDIFWYGRQ